MPPSQRPAAEAKAPSAKVSKLSTLRGQLAAMEGRYTDQYPGIRKLKSEIAAEEAREAQASPPEPKAEAQQPVRPEPVETKAVAPRRRAPAYSNPVLESQLKSMDEDVTKHKQEQARLMKVISGYQKKLETIPVNEQVIAALVRDYDISKTHYQQLLNNQLSAETATQLEIRQKGEKFAILDSAQPAERPSRPNRLLLNAGGSLGGLALGLLLALITEFVGISITSPEQITELSSIPVLEVIPVIQTRSELRIQKRRLIWGTLSVGLLTLIASGAVLFFRFRS